jgi:hypothetical protein
MPRRVTGPRRRNRCGMVLAELSDKELAEVWILGGLVNTQGQPTFTPTPSERIEAGAILRRRGRIGIPPDPRPVLSGDPDSIEAVRGQRREYEASRNRLLNDG